MSTLVFLDSFDHYDTAHLQFKWTVPFLASIAAGRNGQGCAINGSISKTVPPNNEFTIGFAFYAGSAVEGNFYELRGLSTTGGSVVLFELSWNVDQTLSLFAGTADSLIEHPLGFVYTIGTWCYIEISVLIIGGSDVVVKGDVRVNGNLITSGHSAFSGINSGGMLGGLCLASMHTFLDGTSGSEGSSIVDDLYICNGYGAYYGDVRIGVIYPRVDDSLGSFVPNSGATGYNMLKEHPPASPSPDDDSTYIASNTLDDNYLCSMDLVGSLVGTVPAVQMTVYARKDDEGSRALVDYLQATPGPINNYFWLGDDYCMMTYPYDAPPYPGGTGEWTNAQINGTEFGVQITE